MSEVPLTVWLIGSLLLVDCCWANRKPKLWESLAVGCACGLGMLFKGHAIALTLAPLAYSFGRRKSLFHTPREQFKPLLLFWIGFTVPFLLWIGRNSTQNATGFDGINQLRMIRAKDPCDVNSPLLTARESLAVIENNLRLFAIYRIPSQVLPGLWRDAATAWPHSGWLYLPLTILLVALCMPWRSEYFSIHFVLPPLFLLNVQYALGGAARFWIPISILMAILLALRLSRLWEGEGRSPTVVAGVFAVVFSANLLLYAVHHERHPYLEDGPWKEKVEFFQAIAKMNLKARGVRTSNACAFQLITGIRAPIGVGNDDPCFDHAVVRLDATTGTLPAGASEVAKVYPWALYRLPKPLAERDLGALPESPELGQSDAARWTTPGW
jgi:hypothetical protein